MSRSSRGRRRSRSGNQGSGNSRSPSRSSSGARRTSDNQRPDHARPSAQGPTAPRKPQSAPSSQVSPARGGATRGGAASDSALQRWSVRPLRVLHRLPRWVPALTALSLVLLGLFLNGWRGGLAMIALGLFLAWLLALSWPAVHPQARTLRLLVVIVVFFVAGQKLLA